MPKIAQVGRFRLFFYSREGFEPAHIHVEAGGAEAKLWLADGSVARNYGFAEHELTEIRELVRAMRPDLLQAWEKRFGERAG